MERVFIHGSGHKSTSWNETIANMKDSGNISCPELSSLLDGKEASYENLYSSLAEYCSGIDGTIHLCGLSLGGIIGLNYVLDFPEKVRSLVLIGTPHKVPKAAFAVQNMIFRLLPKVAFENMAFNKRDTFALGNSMKGMDFSRRLQDIRCPVLVICGRKDNANIKSARYLSQNIENAKLKIIEDTGHVVNEENPKALAEILERYYSERV